MDLKVRIVAKFRQPRKQLLKTAQPPPGAAAAGAANEAEEKEKEPSYQ